MSKIIVGVDESEGSNDAIALASGLAGITGAELMLVNVFPFDTTPSRAINAGFQAYLRNDSQELLERLRSNLDGAVEVRSVANPSPAHGLHDLAEQEDAALIVVGSTHTGRAGRVLPGSTGERLLHGSPCPVAVAPKAYTQRHGGERGIIGVAYDGSQSAQSALQAAERIAAATGARLRVIRAFQPQTYNYPPATSMAVNAIGSYNDSLQERASKEVEAAAAKIDGEPRAEAFFAVGDAARILIEATEQLDMLFIGSRGYGPMHSVLVGGVSGRVVREAACPVIVLPRKARHVEEDSLFAAAASLHR
jgi:nucleotide-binding universal stress UspA family protein